MRVIVTGANGFVGSWLTRALLREGHDVRILARPSSDLSELQGLSFSPWSGDIRDLESLKRAFAGCDTVFHLAGLISYKRADRQKMEEANVAGTANVLAACKFCGVKKIVFLSSVVAIGAGFTPSQILNEDSRFNMQEYNLGYFETKRAAEALILDAYKKGEITPYILNPSTIYGAGDARKSSRKTQVKVAQGKFPFYTSGGVSVVDIEDVVAGILAAWEKGRPGERYILSGENISIQKLFDLIAEASGVAPPKRKLPDFLVHALGRWGDLLQSLGQKTSLSSENSRTATLYHWFDNSKAKRELGFTPRPARDSISKSVQWMKDNAYIS